MVNQSNGKNVKGSAGAQAAVGSLRLPKSRIGRGQAMVEFALIATLVMMVLLVGVQFAIVGQAALSLSQGASAIARYVAVNEPLGKVSSSFSGNPTADMKGLLSSAILTNSGGDLTVTVNSYQGGTTSTPAVTPRATIDYAIVTLTYDASKKIALPNPFLGINFPTSLSASDSQVYE
jgi:Flp pilus assembly protein TadG